MYSYNDQFTFREQFPRAALDEEIISDTPEILMPEHLSTVVKAAPPPPPSPPFQPTVSNPEEKAESSSSTSSSANNSFISTLASFAKQMSSYGLEDRPKKSSRKKKAEGVRGGDGGIGCQKDLFVKKIPDSSSSTSSPAHPPATKSTPSTTSSSKPKLVVKSPTSVDDKILNKPLPPTKAVSSKNKDYSSSSIAKVSSSKLKSGNGVELNDDKSTTRSSVRSRRSEDKENRFSSKIGKVPMVKEKRSLPVLASFSAQQQDNDSSFYTSKSVMMHPPTLSRSLPTPPVSQPNDVPCKPQSNSSSRVQQTSAVTTSQSSKVELPPRLADLISRYSNNISSVNAWAGS